MPKLKPNLMYVTEIRKANTTKLRYEVDGDWPCAGECGQWKTGMAAAHNGSGYVCLECEEKFWRMMAEQEAKQKGPEDNQT